MPSNKPISLQSLIVLNDEIAALSRAGVPLELGLQGIGTQGQAGRIAERLAAQMRQGKSLVEAIDAEKRAFPAIYRAVVQAGIQSGRLSESLESFTELVKSKLELRRQVRLALIYPVWVFILAYSLFAAFALFVVPRMLATHYSLGLREVGTLGWLKDLSETAIYWAPGIPLAIVGFWFVRRIVWFLTDSGRPLDSLFDMLPWVGSAARSFQHAYFADALALLVRCETPLQTAFPLAAESSGDRALAASGHHIANNLEQGRSLEEALAQVRGGVPPFLSWMMLAGNREGQLAATLSHVSEIYRLRAMQRANWIRALLPVACVVFIGGTVTLAYSLALFVPFAQLLHQLGLESL